MVATGADLQADDKIIVGGWAPVVNTDSDLIVARYTTNGTLDTSFGDSSRPGTISLDYGYGRDRVHAVAVQDDDKIVVAGYVTGNGTQYDMALVRFAADGSTLDGSFGGLFVTDVWNGYDEFNDVALQPDGKIVAVGYGEDSNGRPWPFVARVNADGSPDTNFGTWSPGSGLQIIDQFQSLPGGWVAAAAKGVAVQDDGKIVVVGDLTYPDSTVGEFVARFNSDGTLDTSFAGDGLVEFPPATGAGLTDVAIQNDGKIVLGIGNTNSTEFMVARLNPDGSGDAGFGQYGNAVADFFGARDELRAIALQTNGKIVTAGTASQGGRQ